MPRFSTIWRFVRQFSFAIALAAIGLFSPILPDQAWAQSAAQIRQAQSALNDLGYTAGSPDGLMGPRTKAALKSYQISKGLTATGDLDDATIASLDGTAAPAPPSPQPDPPSSSSSGSGGGALWLIVVGAALVWLYRKTMTGTSQQAQRPRPAPPTKPQYAPQRFAINISSDNWPATGPSLSVKFIEESQNCWVPAGQIATVSGKSISGGMIYVGSSLHRQDGYNGENCLINPSLPVAAQANDSGANMPYWPSYSLIDPSSRRAYLNWLSTGRNEPATYIGYVFLYFYGLERRLMLDNPGNEAPALIAEVSRLLTIYSDNHSFNRYATALLSAATIKFNKEVSWPEPSMRKVAWQLPIDLLVAIGKTVSEGKALDAFQMLAWYNAHPEKRLPLVASRCPDEFKALFKTRFDSKFPNGVTISPPKRILSANYRAASSTFTVDFQVGSAALPDVTGLAAPLNAVDPLVDACAADLATYARLIGKDRSARNDMAAAAALPDQLLECSPGTPIGKLSAWLKSRATGAIICVELKDLLAQVGASQSSDGKIPKADLVLVADALSRCGYGVEPDPRIAYPSNSNASQIAVFPMDKGSRIQETRPEFLSALTQLDIGMIIATVDDHVATTELDFLSSMITKNAALSPAEKLRLQARLLFLSKFPPSARIFNRFKDRPLADREAVARLALSVAAADGVMAIEEMRTLEKLYNTLGLESARLYRDVQALNIGDDHPPVVALGEQARTVSIPPKPKAASPANGLDLGRLAKTRADTAIVSGILGEIFSEGNEHKANAALPASVPSTTPSQTTAFPGLDPKYQSLLAAVVANNSMTRGDFEALTGSHNLMCDGAIEAINDWAYEKFDGPLLEDGANIIINKDVLELAEGHPA